MVKVHCLKDRRKQPLFSSHDITLDVYKGAYLQSISTDQSEKTAAV